MPAVPAKLLDIGENIMKIIPTNKRIQVKLCEVEIKEAGPRAFILPETAQPPSEHLMMEVISVAADCQTVPGDKVVIPAHLLETVNVEGKEIKLISENYVLCIVSE